MTLLFNRRQGFTLVELLVVIAIIAVLAGILFPVFARAKESALRTTALSQSKQLGTALKIYVDDNNDKYLPSTNYGYSESRPEMMWQIHLVSIVRDQKIFIAPGSDAIFADRWDRRGEMSIGYNSATALDKQLGCSDDQEDSNNCISFKTVAEFSKEEDPAAVGLFAVTPNGESKNNYRGYEFSPYNGAPNSEHPKLSPPLVSDRDLVKELTTLGPDALKPIYCRYMSTGQDDGFTPVVFGDGHAKDYNVKQIQDGSSNIIWRFR
jgi:prepilin-type N-terminal cleavage/methylation domain-containing protein